MVSQKVERPFKDYTELGWSQFRIDSASLAKKESSKVWLRLALFGAQSQQPEKRVPHRPKPLPSRPSSLLWYLCRVEHFTIELTQATDPPEPGQVVRSDELKAVLAWNKWEILAKACKSFVGGWRSDQLHEQHNNYLLNTARIRPTQHKHERL